jgi:hypothetical protein
MLRNAKVVCLKSVRQEFVAAALTDSGSSWSEASHIAATGSLAGAIFDHPAAPTPAIPIATLLDLVNGPGLAGEYRCPRDGYPGPDVLAASGAARYREDAISWGAKMKGRRIRLSLAADNEARRWAKQAIAEGDLSARILMRSTRRLLTGIEYLAAAGYDPGNLKVEDALGQAARSAWQAVEAAVPDFSSLRRDFWIDPKVFDEGVHPAALDLRRRIADAFDHVFGPVPDIRTVVHHGFYFYTPIQWAFFNLLSSLPKYRQVFIVHDDGSNPAFQIWREFYKESFGMPRAAFVVPAPSPDLTTDGAAALEAALLGERVPNEQLQRCLELVDYGSPAQFVRAVRTEETYEKSPILYAADVRTVERYVARLGSVAAGSEVDLAHLPIGAFLLGLFSCFGVGPRGETVVKLDEARLLDIAGSGCLPSPGGGAFAPSTVPVLRRALRFFRGCSRPDQWKTRAEHLHRLIISEVVPLGSRIDSNDDVLRLTKAARNPLRLVPWADLTYADAKMVAEVLSSVADILSRLSQTEDMTLRGRFDFLRDRLRSGMSVLPRSIRDQVEAKIDGFTVDVAGEVDVHCLSSAVSLLLGHTVDSENPIAVEDEQGRVRDLRALDALGLTRTTRSLHLANLADGKFPSVVQALPWPFADGQIIGGMPDISARLLKARADHATLSDLYLLWLALDGVEPASEVRMSWISDIAGEAVNPSAVLGLFVEPPSWSESVRRRAGGVAVTQGVMAEVEMEDRPLPTTVDPRRTSDEVRRAIEALPTAVAAIAELCPRRFALQWCMGPSGAFQHDHQHAMLYGNVVGALAFRGRQPVAAAKRICDDIWRNLSEAERVSSMTHRSVLERGGADPVWNFTLSGSRTGTKPHDIAYQTALARKALVPARVADAKWGVLPTPDDTDEMGKICTNCAVRPRCAVWVDEHEI